MKQLKLSWLYLFSALIISGSVFVGCQKDAKEPDVTSNAKGGKATVYNTLTLACAGNTLESIEVSVTAGGTGAPSGFTLQWMTKAEYDVAGWPVNTDAPDPVTQSSFCKGSFSGNANASRYNLGANESVSVVVGAFLMDNGASTNCPEALSACTEYVFRAFAHGDNKMNRSLWSGTLECSTECDAVCTKHGVGYWKNNCNLIVEGLTIGGIEYTSEQLCTILTQTSAGNGLRILGRQLVAAKLNGLSTPDADAAVAGKHLINDSEPANWQAGLIATLRKNNESCSQ